MMKKIFKRLLVVLGSLFGLVAILLGVVFAVSSNRMQHKFQVRDTPVPTYTGVADITEGKRLYFSRGCADCHGENLGGKTFLDDPAMGRFAGANLTAGKGGVLADRTDFDLERAIRHGVGKDGRALIFMPSTDFQGMSNEDVGRLISYIRSAPATDNTPSALVAGPMGRILYLAGQIPVFISAEKIDHNAPTITSVKPGLTAAYGAYIAQTCTGCHNEKLTGGKIQGAPPEWPPASDITQKGLEKWSEQEFVAALRTGKRPNGSDINPIMPWRNLSKMTDTEIKALWLYLKSGPAKKT